MPLALLLLSLGSSAVLIAPATLHAQSTAAAAQDETPRGLFRRGEQEYAAGRYEEAIALWSRAYALDPRPGLQYNLAQAYGRTGQLAEERDALQLFLTRLEQGDPAATSSPDAESARARIVAIDGRIARTAIVLHGLPDDATVELDDSAVTAEGGRLRVAPGTHTIRVLREGYEPFVAAVNVVAGSTVGVHVALHETREGETRIVSINGGRLRIPEVLMATGGVLIASGAVTGIIALNRSSDEPLRGSDRADQAERFALVSDVMLGVGIAAGAAGVIYRVVQAKRARAHRDHALFRPTVASSTRGTPLPAFEVVW